MSEEPDFRSTMIYAETTKQGAEAASTHALARFGIEANVWSISGSNSLREVYRSYNPNMQHKVRELVSETTNGNQLRSVLIALNRRAEAIIIDETYPDDPDSRSDLEQSMAVGVPVILSGVGNLNRFEELENFYGWNKLDQTSRKDAGMTEKLVVFDEGWAAMDLAKEQDSKKGAE